MKAQYGHIVEDLQKIIKRVQDLQKKKGDIRKKVIAQKDSIEIDRLRKIIETQ